MPSELYANILDIINYSISQAKHYEYIRELDGEIIYNDEYESVYFRQRVIIEKGIASKVLRQYFQYCIEKAIKKAHNENKEPTVIVISIFSENTLSYIHIVKDLVERNIINEIIKHLKRISLRKLTTNYKIYYKKQRCSINRRVD